MLMELFEISLKIQRWNLFVMPCNFRPPQKFQNIPGIGREFNTFFLYIM